jgi:DegV family protein with EDD domain
MGNIVIIADSAVDLNAELRQKYGIVDYVHGIVVCPDGSQFLADDDWKNMTPESYFGSMAKGRKIYKSATCSVQEVEDVFSKHLQAGEAILGITIGSAFSGMYNLFVSVAARMKERFPQAEIVIVDSARYSGAYALLVVKAHELINQGKGLAEIGEELNESKFSIHQMGPLDDLFFLNRSGRVSKTIAIMGTMVGIRPLADFQPNGYCEVLGKTKGMAHSLEVSLQYIKQTIVDPEKSTVIISHSNRQKEGDLFAKMIEKDIKPKEVILTSVGQISGANVGPGLVVAFYFGNPISTGCEKERAILAGILGNK